MAKLPAFQFYPGDWLTDAIAGCSIAAQGLWLRMMFIAHNSDRRGYLTQNGSPLSTQTIAQHCGCLGLDEFESLLSELDQAGVPSRTKDGTIYSRRMVRDEKNRLANKFRQQDFRNSHKTNGNSNGNVTAMSQQSSSSISTAKQEQKQIPRKKPRRQPWTLPDFIPEMLWNEYLAMRQRKGKPPTPFALELIAKKLHGFQRDGHDPGAVLEQSIRNGWTDVYPVRDGGNYAASGINRAQARTDANKAAAQAALDRIRMADGDADGTA